MMELFTSFAISVAANIVTTLFARTSSEKEIRTAFQDAIEEWCPNEEIRRFREPTIYSFLKKYIDNPAINEDELTEEQCSFLEVFQKKLAEHQAATNYLSGIKERKYYDEVMSTLHVVNNNMALRALGGTIEDHEDLLIIDTEAHFENVYVEEYGKFEKDGIPMGAYQVVYKDGDYEENLTEVITIPVAMKKNLLDVIHVNEEYYFKLTGYLGEVFKLVKEWRELSSNDEQEGVE